MKYLSRFPKSARRSAAAIAAGLIAVSAAVAAGHPARCRA